MWSVGPYLGVVQFFFALCWTVYVIFLPQLAAQAGMPKSTVIWILMLDQLIFVGCDYATGVFSDRAAHVVGRLGRAVIAVTLLSCAAFLLLPFVAPQGSPALFLAVTVLWSASSSALRAPPLTLVGRYASKPAQPWLVAASLFGLGVANAAAPYLGLHLRDIDPRWPFVLSSVALGAVTLGLVAAEQALSRATPTPIDEVRDTNARVPRTNNLLVGFVLAAVLVALAFQVHVFLNSSALYLRYAKPTDLPSLAPVFWVGFNLALWPGGLAARRWGPVAVMIAGSAAAAAASLLAQHAGSLQVLVGAQCLAGGAWGCLLMSAFSAVLLMGHTGREGTFSGALSSVLALAALMRMLVLAAEVQKQPQAQALLAWAPAACWLAGSALLWAHRLRSPR